MRAPFLSLVHVVGVVVFFANAVAALFWQRRAAGSRSPEVVAYAFRTLNAGDRWLTPLSVVAITASGVGLAVLHGLPILRIGWIFWSLAAFAGSGAVFVAAVLPRQIRLARWTGESARQGEPFDWGRYAVEARSWARWADLSLGLAFVALVLMVFKPVLPAL